MGNKVSVTMLSYEEINEISSITFFKPAEINRLYSRFKFLDTNNIGFVSREALLCIPELAVNPLGERVVDCLFQTVKTTEIVDKNGLNFHQFVNVLSVFINKNICDTNSTKKEADCTDKLSKFLFMIYDNNMDGYICRSDIRLTILLMCGNYLNTYQINDLTDSIFNQIIQFDASPEILNIEKIDYNLFKEGLRIKDIYNRLTLNFLQ